MDRRDFLKAAGAVAAGGVTPLAIAAPKQIQVPSFDLSNGIRRIDLLRPKTGERLRIDYLYNGKWAPDAYSQICWMLRDVRADKFVTMDPKLIAILDWTQQFLAQYGYKEPLHVLSGFRTRQTNEKTDGAAANSLHLYGRAVDYRIPGLSADYLGKLMAWLTQGGIGVYAKDGFVHVDTGANRQWDGKAMRR